MEIFKTIDEFIKLAGEALNSDPIKDGNIFRFPTNFSEHDDVFFEVCEEQIIGILQEFSLMNEFEDTSIVDSCTYEILVSDESSLPRFRSLGRYGLTLKDEENKISYVLSKPSNGYLVFLIYKLSEIAPIRSSVDQFFLRMRMHRRDNGNDEVFDKDLFSALRNLFPRCLTLRIESEKQKSVNEFIRFANSFFFQLSYNLDIPIVPQRYLDDLVRRGRITRGRRVKSEELEAPKRIYLPDLIYHYQLAVASDSPALEYLSYYHILEYFFEAVFNDDLIQRVTNKITEPDFSYKRKKDVQKLINEIGKSLKFRGDNTSFSELEALRLTIERYVNIIDLIEKINAYDETLIDYYRMNRVEFSNGDIFDMENEDCEKTIRQIANRIYKTRNAIVHSKESEKSRYIPFEDDKILVKEVPLLRFLAEIVIIESSSIIS